MSRPDTLPCTATGDGIILTLHIQPRASKNEVCGIHGDALKVRLTSPPVDGAANKLCREFLAELFHVPKSSVTIISGESSRHKRIMVIGGGADRLKQILEQIGS